MANIKLPLWKYLMVYKSLLAGFFALVMLMTFELTMGLFVGALALLIIWVLAWILACLGGFMCYLKFPRALHVCHGIAVALIFGILATASFSIFMDIDKRVLYEDVPVDGPTKIEPQEGSIVYFTKGAKVYTNIIGQSSEGSGTTDRFFCVAPIVGADFNSTDASDVHSTFWASCEVSKLHESCSSPFFESSDCYKNWKTEWDAGFVVTGKDLIHAYSLAVEQAVNTYKLNRTIVSTSIVVAWVSDPIREGNVFWALGLFCLISAPIVYSISGIVYALFCKLPHRY
jgi:hypothetical protein